MGLAWIDKQHELCVAPTPPHPLAMLYVPSAALRPERVTLVLSLIAMLGVARLLAKQVAAPTGVTTLIVFNHSFCHVLHGGAMMSMCTLAGPRCNIVNLDPGLQPKLAFSHVHKVDSFAAPIVVDGDMRIAQSVAATAYLGERLGFAEAVTHTAKGVQLLLDMRDFVGEIKFPMTVLHGVPYSEKYHIGGDLAATRLEAKVASGRYDLWMSYLNDSIAGPYFFGESPTYVDFYLESMLVWIQLNLEGTRRAGFCESELFTKYTKIVGMWKSIQKFKRDQTMYNAWSERLKPLISSSVPS